MLQLAASHLQSMVSMINRGLDCTIGKNKAFQEAVGSQTVCTMQAGMRNFASSKQSGNGGLATQVSLQAARS